MLTLKDIVKQDLQMSVVTLLQVVSNLNEALKTLEEYPDNIEKVTEDQMMQIFEFKCAVEKLEHLDIPIKG